MDASILLRAGAVVLAGATFVGAGRFVLEHPKNPEAPLQPPAAGDVALRVTPTPSATGATTSSANPRTTQRPVGTPPPRITLQPGVRATALPGVTYTHVS